MKRLTTATPTARHEGTTTPGVRGPTPAVAAVEPFVCRVAGLSSSRSASRLAFTLKLTGLCAALARNLAVAGFALAFGAALAAAPPDAIGSLYLEGFEYLCTASAVSGPELGYEPTLVVLTAAHCVESDLRRDPATSAWSNPQRYQVSFDGQAFFDVTPHRVGFADAGYDVAVLLFDGGAPELAPLTMGAWDGVDFGTPIHNWANPLGMGIQYFTGSVTMLRLEPSPGNRNDHWLYNAVASLQVGPGSSGSLILNEAREYVGVLSGVVEARFGSPFTVFVPQWKILEFLESDEAAREVTCGGCPVFSAQGQPIVLTQAHGLSR